VAVMGRRGLWITVTSRAGAVARTEITLSVRVIPHQ
jgi:hypothetical protein